MSLNPSAAAIPLLAMLGCSTLDSDARIKEAAKLAEQRTETRPDWEAEWDTKPTWESGSVLAREQAVALALRNNRDLRAELEMIGQADADLLQAGLLQNPAINLMLMFPDGGGRAMLRANALPMMPLQDLWLIPARKKVAQAMLQEAVLRVADRAIETAASAKKAYAKLQYVQRALELLGENQGIIEQAVQVLVAQQSANRATQMSVNRMQVRALRIQSERMAMEEEHHHAQLELLELLAMADAPANCKAEAISELRDSLDAPHDERSLLAAAAEGRLDVKAAEWQVRSAEQNIRLMRREGLPDLALGFTLERMPAPQSNNPKLVGAAGNAAAQGLFDRAMGMTSTPMMDPAFMPKERMVKYNMGPMIELEIPIFDWGQAKVARAVHEYRQRMAEYESKVQQTVRMVRDTRVMLKQAYEQVEFYRSTILPVVERNLDVSRRSFIAGQEDLTVYLEVQEDLLMTRLKILEYYRDYLVNRAELERQIGGSFKWVKDSTVTTQPAASAGE